ncbi:MAG: energy-coupling factor transporter ATPase [Clostridia bacterium]|nr:energy-coupling factor transporter ATPase [Clostridia bacterium]
MKALEFKNVSFSYRKAEEGKTSSFAVKGVNFSVEEGEFVAVLGHNGSGKSTLARLANGLLEASDGSVEVFGVPLSEQKNLFSVRKNVGIVFQNPDNQTVASIVEDDIAFGPENIGVPREEIGVRIEESLAAVGMSEYKERMTSALSGGQKQRIAIAGVLALKPKIMILDESTAMLDPKGRREIMQVVKKLNKEEGMTILLITHFMEEALMADRAIVMNRGEIVMQGTPEEIFERHDELETYNLALPPIGVLWKKLEEGGMPVGYALTPEDLAEEIAKCISKSSA